MTTIIGSIITSSSLDKHFSTNIKPPINVPTTACTAIGEDSLLKRKRIDQQHQQHQHQQQNQQLNQQQEQRRLIADWIDTEVNPAIYDLYYGLILEHQRGSWTSADNIWGRIHSIAAAKRQSIGHTSSNSSSTPGHQKQKDNQQLLFSCSNCLNSHKQCMAYRNGLLAMHCEIARLCTVSKSEPWDLPLAIKRLAQHLALTEEILQEQQQLTADETSLLQSNNVFPPRPAMAHNTVVVKGRGAGDGEDSPSASSTSSASSIVDDLPDIMVAEPPGWRGSRRSCVSAEGCTGSLNDLPYFSKSAEEIEKIRQVLVHSFVFEAFDEKTIERLIFCLKEVNVGTNTNVIRQGDCGDGMYFVETGKLFALKHNGNNEEKLIREINPQHTFGEIALLHSGVRSFTVTAQTPCKLWFLHKSAYNILLNQIREHN